MALCRGVLVGQAGLEPATERGGTVQILLARNWTFLIHQLAHKRSDCTHFSKVLKLECHTIFGHRVTNSGEGGEAFMISVATTFVETLVQNLMTFHRVSG
jgi:hypothetical protein